MNVAIITGASVGIGAASAQSFIEDGFEVFNLSRRACPIDAVKNISCDLSNQAAIDEACSSLLDAIKEADSVALVHNACQMRKDNTLECESDSLREVLETNLIAANSINQQLLSHMPRTSSVIYMGSTLSEKAVGRT